MNDMTLELYTFPTEAELAQGRANSSMTRDEALRSVDRLARLCAMLTAQLSRHACRECPACAGDLTTWH